jgi:hypothetical protein
MHAIRGSAKGALQDAHHYIDRRQAGIDPSIAYIDRCRAAVAPSIAIIVS